MRCETLGVGSSCTRFYSFALIQCCQVHKGRNIIERLDPSLHARRVHLNINGVLSWHERTILHRQEDKITSAAMIALFAEIEAHHPTATAIPVVLDNARYNHSKELRHWLARAGCRIRPVYLPSYAPNLNMIERFWRFMKRKVLHNKYYPTSAAFRAAFDQFFANVGGWKAELETLLTPKFHFIGAPANGIP